MSDFPSTPLPRLARIEQRLPSDGVADVAGAVRDELRWAGVVERVQPGHEVAITAGSRGIADIPLVIRTVVEVVRDQGAAPFIVPAMGSHGGATPEGQRHVLAEYGITEASVGAPIRAAMETVELGTLANGAIVHFDALAAGADATIVVNRVKPHTSFRGSIESGLCKMTCIGLGKRHGAEQVHAHGLGETIPAAAELSLARSNIIGGLALVENASHRLAIVRGAAPAAFHDTDRELLKLAAAYLPRVPFEHLHVLVVEWMGKDVSGSGMDYNVIGMWRRIGGERVPDFETVVVLNLTEASDGNGLGVGIADFTTRRLYDKLNLRTMYLNGLTSHALLAIKIPIVLESDREAIEVALHSTNAPTAAARVAVIRNTLELSEMLVSEALLPEVDANPTLRVIAEPEAPPFDAAGTFSPKVNVTSS